MTTLDLRGIAQTGRLIRATDSAYGFEQATSTEAAVRRSTWQQALELSGIWIQYSTDGSTPSDTASNSDTHFRVSSGTERPGNSSSRWSAWITLGAPLTDAAILDVAQSSRTSADRGKVLAVAATDEDALALLAITADANRFILYTLGNLYIAQASATPPAKPTPAQITATTTGITATTAPGWQLTRPEATEALPNVFDVHVYGVDIDGVFGVLVGTPNRTDRYIDTYTDAEADARVQAAKGTAIPQNTPGTASAGTSNSWAPDDHDHGVTATGGSGLDQAAVDARVRAGVADWAETGNNDAFPLAKINGAQESTVAEMRIRWSGSQAGLNAIHFNTGQDGRGNTRDGTIAPLAVGVNEFLGIWIGTAEASITDIEEGGTTVLGDLFPNIAAGEPLTVDGTSGTVFRTATAVSTVLWSSHRFRATLMPLHFGDVVDQRVRDDVVHWALAGDTEAIPSNKLTNTELPRWHHVAAGSQFTSLRTAGVDRLVADRDLTITAVNTITDPDGTQITSVKDGDLFIWNEQSTPNRWERFGNVSEGLDQTAVDARVQAAKGTATPVNTGTASAGTSNNWSPDDHDHGITAGGTADGVADSVDLAVSGSDLTLTVGRSGTLTDLTDTVTLPTGSVTGTTSVETRIGHVDSVGVNSQTFRVVALDEDFATGNDYQLIVTDDSTGNTASTQRFSGERARAKALATGVPTTIGNSIISILTWREDITTPATASVSRWAVVPGRTRREVFVVGQNSGNLGTLTIEVFKYPRAAQGLKGDQGEPGSGGGVTFGSAAGEVAEWAEGNNTDDIPHSKLPTGTDQTEAELRIRWNTATSWSAPAPVVVSTTGVVVQIPTPLPADLQLEFLVRIDTSSELRDILIGGSSITGDRVFATAPVAFMLDGVLYQHYTSIVQDDDSKAVLDATTIEVRLVANVLDQHIAYEVEEYLIENPVVESITLSDSAFTTINSAGSQVALTWPSALTQTGGTGEVALDDLRALRDAGQILPYSANVTLLGSSPTVDNRENINDGDLTTFATFNGSTKTAVVCDWGRVVRRPRVHVWANGVSSFSFRGVNGNGHDAGALFNVSTVNGKTVWDAGERDLRGMFLQQSGGSPTVNIFLIYVEDTRLTEVTYDAATRQLLGLNLALPEATSSAAGLLSATDKTAYDGEPALREAADTALSTRIDGLVTMPAAGESLLDLVASTYPRDIVFTLGTRIPGGSDPGYNAGTHSLNAVGSFSETGIPTDIVALYRVTESETVGGVQLQNRLIVGIDEEGGSRRYEGEAVRWAGQQVTLTYFQRSLNNFNEYYSDVVTTLATAGQTVAFNVEDVQAEARETIPYRRWIWHHAVATTTEHISNDDFTDATASEVFAPTQHAVADYAISSDTIRTTVRALGSASDTELPSERGVRVAIDAAVENISSPDPITLIASGTFSASYNGARAEEFTLSQALEDGWLLEWSEGTRPRSVAYILSDTIRSQTETFTTGAAVNAGPPHDRIGSVQVPITRHDNTADVNTSLYFHRSSDTAKLYIGHGIGTALTFRLRAFPLAGGSSSQGVGGLGGQNTYGSELIYLKSATATPTNTTKPTGIGYTGTGYSGLGSWTTVAPEAEAGFNILIIQLTRTFSGGAWHVGVGNIGQWYEGVNQQMPVRYIDFGGEFTFTRSAENQYVEIWLSADNRYSEPIQIAGRASADLLLLARQDLPVSGTSTAGPTIATVRTLLRNYPKIGVNVQLRLGAIILRQKYFEIATEDIVPLSVADQNNTRAQRMLALAVNSPFAAGPNWIDLAIIDGNTTVQRHPSGYTRRYLMNFIRANNDPDGDSARVFSFINVAEHDAGTFASGVRIEFFGVQ